MIARIIALVVAFVALACGAAAANGSPVDLGFSYVPSITAGVSDPLTVVIRNTEGGAVDLSSLTLNLPLPSGMTFTATPNAATTCAGGSAGTSGSTLTLTGATLLAGQTCSVSVDITSLTPGAYVLTAASGIVSSAQGVTNSATGGATIDVYPPVVVTPSFAPASIVYSQVSTYTITFANTGSGATAMTNMTFTEMGSPAPHPLPAGLVVAPIPNASTTCGTGVVTATAGASSVGLTGGTLGAGATCSLSVAVTPSSVAAAAYTDTIAAFEISSSSAVTNTAPASATLTVGTASPLRGVLTGPLPVVQNAGVTPLFIIYLANDGTNPVPLSGVAFTVTLPSGVSLASPANLNNNCGGTATASGSTITLSGGAIDAVVPLNNCSVSVNLQPANAGNFVLPLPVGSVTTTQGVTNSPDGSLPWTVYSAVVAAPSFAPSTIATGATSTYTITFSNTGSNPANVTGMSINNHALPAGVTIAATPNTTNTCGGTTTATAGGTTVDIENNALAPGTTCTVSVAVTASAVAAYTDTVAANEVNAAFILGPLANAPASATLNVVTPSPVVLTPSFTPSTIFAAGTSTYAIAIANTGANAVPLGALALSNTLPAGLTLATVPNATTTCSGGSATTSGGNTIALSGATLGAGATCSLTVAVTGTTAGPYTATIAASAVTTTQGVTNAAPASAILTVSPTSPVAVQLPLPAQTTTGLPAPFVVTLANTGANAIPLTGVGLTLTLPAGASFAATPNATTTCPSGSASIAGQAISLGGAALGAGATCTLSVNVTSATTGVYNVVLIPGAVSSTQGVTNASGGAWSLFAYPPVTVAPSFTPPSIAPGQTTTYAVTIANTGAGADTLSALALSVPLPAGIAFAPTPNAATTCPSGAASATGTTLALSGGTLASGASCVLSVTVTAPAVATVASTIPALAVTSFQNITNTAAGSANLTVSSTALVSVVLPPNAPTTTGLAVPFVVTLGNTGGNAIPLTGVGLTLTLPAGASFAATPNPATTCPSGAVSIAGQAVTLAGAALTTGASCTLSVDVTRATSGTSTVNVAPGAVSSTQGITNAAGGSWTLTAAPPVVATPAFAPAAVAAGAPATLSVTIANAGTGAVALAGLAAALPLPAGVTFAAPNASTTCGGSASAAGTTLTLANGTLAAGATCTFSASVSATTTGTYTATLSAQSVTSTPQNVTNLAPASAALTVNATSPVTATPSFAAGSIVATATTALTIAIANTGQNAVPLTGLGIVQALPAHLVLGAAPAGATTCPGGTVTAVPGGATLTLAGATLAAGASCTVSAVVTGATVGAYTATTAAGSVTSAQGITNTAAATANLQVAAAAPVTVTASFAPSTVALGQPTALSVTIANTASGAAALSSVSLNIAIPSGLTIATPSNATTTCASGSVTAAAGSASLALAGAALAAGASCTLSANLVPTANGTGTVAIPAGSVTSTQSATNTAAAQATVTITSPALAVTKKTTLTGTVVSAGQPVGYTIAIANTGAAAETNATLVDTPANATLASGSVRVNGVAAPDAVLSGTTPFGSIAAGATTTISYTANVLTTVANGAQVTNRAVVSGDQPCSGTTCSASAAALTVQPPQLTATLTVDGKATTTVVPQQVVTFASTVSNVGGSTAENVTFTDTLPAGITPIPGSITTSSGTRVPLAATGGGQTVSIPLGQVGPGASITVTYQARITAPIAGQAVNTVTVGALGLATSVTSNVVVVQSVNPVLVVTKTASASVVSAGDRVDFRVTVSGPAGIAFGATSIVDQLPAGMLYAPGTARLNGAAIEPVVAGRTLTWTLPSFANAPPTLTYATAIGAGPTPNATLTNTVNVVAAAPGGAPAATGSGSASVAVIASAFGSCYPITGRAYVDVHRSGRFEPGDRGVAGVRIDLDDGSAVVTDAQGRYNFPCVRQGMHALRLVEQSLPAGVMPFPDHDMDSERSTRRLVHRTFDDTIVEDINFALDDMHATR